VVNGRQVQIPSFGFVPGKERKVAVSNNYRQLTAVEKIFPSRERRGVGIGIQRERRNGALPGLEMDAELRRVTQLHGKQLASVYFYMSSRRAPLRS
jgi:hypothetical protein